MRLEQLEYFIEVVRCQSINKAAKNLFISQPNLSQSIANLEKEIGSLLLKRSRQGVTPTLEGVEIYRDALKILDIVGDSLESWKKTAQNNKNLQGNVAIMSIPGAMTLLSNHVLLDLKKSCPNIDISVFEEALVDTIIPLVSSRATIGIGSYEMPLEDKFLASVPDEWIIEPLMVEELSVLVSRRHPFSKKDYLTAEDLQQLHLAYYDHLDRPCESDPFYVSYFKNDSFSRLNRKESILQLVAENGAVAVYPPKITQLDIYRTSGQIRALPIDDGLDFPEIMHYLVYRKDRTSVENKVIEFVRYCFNTYINTEEVK